MILDRLLYKELKLIASAPGNNEDGEIDKILCDILSKEEQARYNDFGDAWIQKLISEGLSALPVPVPAVIPALPGLVPVPAPQPNKLI